MRSRCVAANEIVDHKGAAERAPNLIGDLRHLVRHVRVLVFMKDKMREAKLRLARLSARNPKHENRGFNRYYVCVVCGQTVDQCDRAQAAHHEQKHHTALPAPRD